MPIVVADEEEEADETDEDEFDRGRTVFLRWASITLTSSWFIGLRDWGPPAQFWCREKYFGGFATAIMGMQIGVAAKV